MFKDVSQQPRPLLTFYVDEQPRQVPAGYTVAAALLALGYKVNRASPVSGSPRGPYCMMGVCFECLVEIDGIPNRQGCLTEVRPEMHIRLPLQKEQSVWEEGDDGC
ncbi:(2Fe-2S)-binding protein [uncultured Oceanisphaera sp.]|uniref:(2Fe-2S)-binding protein n=1 Tax=uncultured Oceanisphaera sp. TaxID=353858 RepID=UPI00261F546B|nr:(2Fe-2S)-binding protein [uncultured Oceanisphaera sp.]